MPNPWRDPTLQKKVEMWCKKNPNRWFDTRLEDIHAETGVSVSTLHRYFALIAAGVSKRSRSRDTLKPSEIIAKRRENMGKCPLHQRLSDEEVARIQKLYGEGNSTLDVAFATGRSPSQCEKYFREMEVDA